MHSMRALCRSLSRCREIFLPGWKARLFPIEWTKPIDFGEEFDIHVNNRRLLEHFHERNMTYKSEGITSETPKIFLEVPRELDKERGLEDGTLVRHSSPYGNAKVQCLITDRVKGKEVCLPMNDTGDGTINQLSSSYADKDTDTPAFRGPTNKKRKHTLSQFRHKKRRVHFPKSRAMKLFFCSFSVADMF